MTILSQQKRARIHFESLSREEQAAAIRRLAGEGMSDYGIAAATKLSVEMIRQVLGERLTGAHDEAP